MIKYSFQFFGLLFLLVDFYDNNTNIKISTSKQHYGKNID